jgi:hypothetical protein
LIILIILGEVMGSENTFHTESIGQPQKKRTLQRVRSIWGDIIKKGIR